MAYFGDRACTRALIDAIERGGQHRHLHAARANILGDLNRATCAKLLRATRSPSNLRIYFHPRMVHGKAIVGDGAWVDIGSTNFTPLSHGAYEEVDLYCRDAALAACVEGAIEAEIAAAERVQLPVRYRRAFVAVEKAISVAHARKARRRRKKR